MTDIGKYLYMFSYQKIGDTVRNEEEVSGSLWGLSLHSKSVATAEDSFDYVEAVVEQLRQETNHVIFRILTIEGNRTCLVINCPNGLPDDWVDDQVVEDAIYSIETINAMQRLENLGSNGGLFSVN